MAKLTKIDGTKDDGCEHLLFWCPGCKMSHKFITGPGSPRWNFNGSFDKPTFTPSLVNTREYGEEGRKKEVCHLYLTDGKIRFLNDCTHELAGKTVDLPDLDHE